MILCVLLLELKIILKLMHKNTQICKLPAVRAKSLSLFDVQEQIHSSLLTLIYSLHQIINKSQVYYKCRYFE